MPGLGQGGDFEGVAAVPGAGGPDVPGGEGTDHRNCPRPQGELAVDPQAGLAERLLAESRFTSDADRLAYAFRLCTSRQPSESEITVLLASLDRLHKRYEADKDDAVKLLAIGEKPKNDKLDSATVAAWAEVCDLLLNLDETLTKE